MLFLFPELCGLWSPDYADCAVVHSLLSPAQGETKSCPCRDTVKGHETPSLRGRRVISAKCLGCCILLGVNPVCCKPCIAHGCLSIFSCFTITLLLLQLVMPSISPLIFCPPRPLFSFFTAEAQTHSKPQECCSYLTKTAFKRPIPYWVCNCLPVILFSVPLLPQIQWLQWVKTQTGWHLDVTDGWKQPNSSHCFQKALLSPFLQLLRPSLTPDCRSSPL